MKENKPQLWNEIWNAPSSIEEDIFNLTKAENCIRWQRIEKIILREFESFNNLKVVEIGSGIGTYAALMAKREAEVTLFDYSENALKRAREFFKRIGLTAKFIKQDALSLSADFLDQYDVSMSFGLAEHFRGTKRIKINKAHFDVLRKGGIAFISVPNKHNPPYRIFKFVAEHTGRWTVGEEYPYSRKELGNICGQIGITRYSFLGESLFASFDFITRAPRAIIRKLFKLKSNVGISRKKERGTFLDEYLSYALVVYGKK